MHSLSGDPALTAVFAQRGPFVTAYFDATRPDGAAADVVDERWGLLRDALEAEGADEDTLDAIEEVLPVDLAVGRSYGLVIVAADGEVSMRERMDPPPSSVFGTVSPLPYLLPYLVTRVPGIPHLVITTSGGRTRILQGADGEFEQLWPTDGADRLDAEGVARVVARFASQVDPDVILIAGDDESAKPLTDVLGRRLVDDVAIRVIDLPADTDGLYRAIATVLHNHARKDRDEVLGVVSGWSGDRARVANGAKDVAAALRMAQVGTLVLSDGPAMTSVCWVGARPTEFGLRDRDAAGVGVRHLEHDRIGSALVRAALATGARLLITRPGEYEPPQGVAALLR